MAMLVLTRRVGEEIVIDGGIIVKIVGVKGGLIRLGITAPPSVCVDRREVHERRTEFVIEKEDPAVAPFTCEAVGGVDTPSNVSLRRKS
jgi:carbon storage regulator